MSKVFKNKNCNFCNYKGKVIESWGKSYCKPCYDKKPKSGIKGNSGMVAMKEYLIQNEFAFFTNFSFTPNFDAGVFEYNNTSVDGLLMGVGDVQDQLAAKGYGELLDDAHVYHFNKGVVYPKEIEVSISFTVLHDYPLGFGGPRRPGEPLKWAQNENKDWPHGTPDSYPKLEYMSQDDIPLPTTPQINPNPTPSARWVGKNPRINYIIDSSGNIIIED